MYTIKNKNSSGAKLDNRDAENTIRQAADWLMARGVDNAYWEARWLFDSDFNLFEARLEKRAKGKPLQYVLGKQPFRYLNLKVEEGVFVPRPETEILVEKAIAKVKDKKDSIAFLDIGTGSGAIALSLAFELPLSSGYATDISPLALEVAKTNAKLYRLEERVNLRISNFFDELRGLENSFDLIVSNPPYVAENEFGSLSREILFEPRQALYSGQDGLDAYRIIIEQARFYLKEGGWLALEVGFRQAEQIKGLLAETGEFNSVETVKDYSGIDRVVLAQRRSIGKSGITRKAGKTRSFNP